MKLPNKISISGALVLLASMVSPATYASVTMVGTRVIYAASYKEQGLSFTNPDQHPNLVQIWFDRGNPSSDTDAGDPPFVATPPMFRIEPNSAQVVRLSYVGEVLPTDRESLFYLNFLQVPAIKSHTADANQLVLTVRSRLKVFYRPETLARELDMAGVHKSLSFSIKGQGANRKIIAHNPSGYFVVVQRASLNNASSDVEVARAALIPPKQEVSWTLPKDPVNVGSARLRLKIVNDYGGEVTEDYDIR